MQGLLEHIESEYSGIGGALAGTDLEVSGADPEQRRIVGRYTAGPRYDNHIVISARPVGGRNAGTFQGWVSLSRAEMRRIRGARPKDWNAYTLMVGFAPDDTTIWWSALYDDDRLAKLDAEPMEDGRWYRIAPEDADQAMVGSSNTFQQDLGLNVPGPEPVPPTVAEIILDTIHAGLSLILDNKEMANLSEEQVIGLQRRMAKASENLINVREWRHKQSLSGATSARRRRG